MRKLIIVSVFFFFNDPAPPEISPLPLPAPLPISADPGRAAGQARLADAAGHAKRDPQRSEEHTSELQSRPHLVCRLLLEKKRRNPEGRIPPQDSATLKTQSDGQRRSRTVGRTGHD